MNDSSRQSAGTSETIFGRLWLVRDVAALGEWILFIGFIAYLGVFTDSPRTITILVLTQLVPPFLLGPVVRRVITWRNAVAFGITAYLMRATILLPLFLIQREEGVQPILVIATIAAILIVLWLIGLLTHVAGGLIHLLLVIAVIVFIFHFIRGRAA